MRRQISKQSQRGSSVQDEVVFGEGCFSTITRKMSLRRYPEQSGTAYRGADRVVGKVYRTRGDDERAKTDSNLTGRPTERICSFPNFDA